MSELTVSGLLTPAAVRLGERAADRTEAIRRAGAVLVESGAVDPAYVDSMLAREESISTYVGEEVAIPHGTLAGRALIRRDALSFVRFAEPVDWGGAGPVTVAIGIAAAGDGQVEVLAELAGILLDPDRARALREAASPEEVVALLQPRPEEDG
ncbi:MAG TPA: PTS sugar transporter subunit IIA [Mycobacteriales bacterium]|jgi:PTS system mannitol-specific IIA component|nr:PTS sugar transporter subunit IIA [Mycobacteriales bacterium]